MKSGNLRETTPKVVVPPALRKGDKVAVLSPSSPVHSRDGFNAGLRRLESWGLKPVVMPSALTVRGYLAGDDGARAADLQAAFENEDLRGIFAARGGYGCTRILHRLDFSPLARDPVPIVGFSDITALLAATWREFGLVGFHGPMVVHSKELEMGVAAQRLQCALISGKRVVPLADDGDAVPHVIATGRAEGRLVGGNLTIVNALIGTPWEIDTRAAILFLEDIDEEPYRIDRMLTQLRDAGFLEHVAGVVLGDFHLDGQPATSEDPEITRVLRDRLGDLGVPVAHGFPFGHRPRSWTLPVGIRARLEAAELAGRARLRLLEPAVS